MEYMFINRPEFIEPIRVLFLCGAKFNNSESDKRVILKKYLETDPKNKIRYNKLRKLKKAKK